MDNVFHKNINVGVGSKCQTLQQMYSQGNKSVKSSIEFTVGSRSAKLNLNVCGHIVHTHTHIKISVVNDCSNNEWSTIYIAQFISYTVKINRDNFQKCHFYKVKKNNLISNR